MTWLDVDRPVCRAGVWAGGAWQQYLAILGHSMVDPHRAPRLSPDQLIAPHITRVGRFRKVDPTTSRPLPGCAKIVGVVVWAAFVAEIVRRAWRASRDQTS